MGTHETFKLKSYVQEQIAAQKGTQGQNQQETE